MRLQSASLSRMLRTLRILPVTQMRSRMSYVSITNSTHAHTISFFALTRQLANLHLRVSPLRHQYHNRPTMNKPLSIDLFECESQERSLPILLLVHTFDSSVFLLRPSSHSLDERHSCDTLPMLRANRYVLLCYLSPFLHSIRSLGRISESLLGCLISLV